MRKDRTRCRRTGRTRRVSRGDTVASAADPASRPLVPCRAVPAEPPARLPSPPRRSPNRRGRRGVFGPPPPRVAQLTSFVPTASLGRLARLHDLELGDLGLRIHPAGLLHEVVHGRLVLHPFLVEIHGLREEVVL